MLTVDFDPNDGGEFGLLSLATPEFYLQVSLITTELAGLTHVPEAKWAERRYVRAGECMGLTACWSWDEQTGGVALTLGDDPETSSVVVSLSGAAVEDLLRLARLAEAESAG